MTSINILSKRHVYYLGLKDTDFLGRVVFKSLFNRFKVDPQKGSLRFTFLEAVANKAMPLLIREKVPAGDNLYQCKFLIILPMAKCKKKELSSALNNRKEIINK